MARRKKKRTPAKSAKPSTDAEFARRAASTRRKAEASRAIADLAHKQSMQAHIQAESAHVQAHHVHGKVHSLEEDMERQAKSPTGIPHPPKTGAKPPDKGRGSPVLPATLGEQPESKLPFTVVGIGASAGGFEAVTSFLAHLPRETGMAIVVLQHLDPTHPSHLAELLAKISPVPVNEIRNGMEIAADHVHVMPSNTTVVMENGRFKVSARTPVRGVSMPIDIFFRSMAMEQQNRAIGILLSGSGTDGTLGIAEIKGEGGITFAQDQGTAKHFGMPGSAIAAGNIDFVLSPEQIAKELARLSGHPYVARKKSREARRPAPPLEGEALLREGSDELRTLFMLLRTRSGVDFSLYKPGTLNRRIMRRMVLHKIDSVGRYVKFVQDNPGEVDALFNDLLISVTGFFRDANSFHALQKRILPKIMRSRPDDTPLRIWSCGCSTGEEAYSLAIAVSEFLEKEDRHMPVQIFASDLNDRGIEKARAGIYHENILLDVSSERLRRFFAKVDGFYQVKKSIRDLCVFARQNVVIDPPFSNLDMITCRNVLIYLTPVLQKRIIPIFHYALKPQGYLLLGSSETIGDSNELFELVDKRNKIYSKKPTAYRPAVEVGRFATRDQSLPMPTPSPQTRKEELPGASLQEKVDRLILSRYSPNGVIINPQFDVLQFRGQTGAYLEHHSGAASLNLLKMVRDELALDVRRAVNKAIQTGDRVEHRGAQLRMRGGQTREISIEVHPVGVAGEADHHFLVLFREEPVTAEGKTEETGKGAPSRRTEARQVTRLREELASTKESLQAIIEEQEATNEELKSANEEIQSSNEELQSTNEELETAREELQSTNEELTTLNLELQNRNAELGQLNNDLTNLINSVNSALIILGTDLTVRRFTPSAEKIFNLIPSDVGRRLSDLSRNIQVADLDQTIEDVIENLTPVQREVQDRDGRGYLLRIRPYRTQENRIEGVVLMLVDIDEVKRAIRQVIGMVRQPVLSLHADLRVNRGNDAFYQMFQLTSEQVESRVIFDLEGGAWDSPRLHNLLEEVLPKHLDVHEFKLEHTFPKIGQRTLLVNARRLTDEGHGMPLIILTFEDVSERQ